MRSLPTHIRSEQLLDVLDQEWGLRGRLEYRPVGAGAYHWELQAEDGGRRFVTCDDLDTKPWLGSDRDSVLAGLETTYRTVLELGHAGASFVVAPETTGSGDPLVRLDTRTTVAVFPFVTGQAGRWGGPIDDGHGRDVVGVLAELHRAAAPRCRPPRDDLVLPDRAILEASLDELGAPWQQGPLSEAARRELEPAAPLVRGWLDDLDRLTSQLGPGPGDVVTHGEPHPENFMWTAAGPVLLDWDRVAMARPERDMWMLDDGLGAYSELYRKLTGTTLDPVAMKAYRLLWALTDLAAFVSELRRPHTENADTTKAVSGIALVLGGREPAPYG